MLVIVQATVFVAGFAVIFRAARHIAGIRREIFALLRERYGEIDRELEEIDRAVRATG